MAKRLQPQDEEFVKFWNWYPRRIGKLAAQRAFTKARREFGADEIMAGLENYVQHMPADPQFQCHPATFLNQGRFLDDYTPAKQKPKATHGSYKLYVPLKDRGVC